MLDCPRNLRFSLGGLMAAVAILALVLAIFVLNARMRVNWNDPRIDDITVAGPLTLAETVVLYYSYPAIVITRGLLNPAKSARRISRFFIYGPVLAILGLIALLQVLDAIGAD